MANTLWSCIQKNDSGGLRSWGSALSSALQTVGLVKTSDSGQANWSTITEPSGANEVRGYEIYRFDDALQTTAPVYIKVEYGSGVTYSVPAVWITVGTGTDGAGTLTGRVSSRLQIACGNSSSNSYACRANGANNRIVVWLYIVQYNIGFSIERTHNNSGADNSDGVIIFVFNQSNTAACQYIPFSGTVGSVYSKFNSCVPSSGTAAVDANVALFPVRAWGPGETCPSKNICNYFAADLTTGNVVTATLWDGTSVQVWPSGQGNSATYCSSGNGSTISLAMRAD